MTNIRLFTEPIPESEHNKILNQYIIADDSKTSMILQEFKQEQYTIMSEEDISEASKDIKYLERMILRETKINEILK